ncbi:cap [Donkey kirkovirus Hetian-58]|nr:cap [Donkey kirkovirus Hetian-46]UJP31660.1 cap [Donkey kirkovirus Hetian-48]UJP31666.1 cap [Donkey kirkovirus Hetian-58]UJP31759.1 capsid protein [Porcine kirkovirus Cj-D5]UJP31765.1 capsid protein [Porcine kirkovirus Cj-D32]UJP31771.1 capsid protein [Porcine kirkovirus Cj-D43]
MSSYYRKTKKGQYKREKYSRQCISDVNTVTLVDTLDGNVTIPHSQQISGPIIPSTTVQGQRKVKNMSIDLAVGKTTVSGGTTAENGEFNTPILFAVVYHPEGTEVNNMATTRLTASGVLTQAYVPEQNVIFMRMLSPVEGSVHCQIPLSRNINAGDSIDLIVFHPLAHSHGSTLKFVFGYNFQYSIAY